MTDKTSPSRKSPKIARHLLPACLCLVLIGIVVWFVLRKPERPQKSAEPTFRTAVEREEAASAEQVIDFDKLQENTDEALTALMEARKAPYGVEDSIDMIVKPEESIKVGGETLRVKKILDEVRLTLGEIVETDLMGETQPKEGDHTFGIHVVQANENIWDIHFNLLKDYYDHKGIQLSPLADEPNRFGRSSGVGKILKFSENLVHIYNLKKRKLETDLDHIYPLSKIVIYNMGRVFALLDRIDYKNIHRIEFDGETLWLPATQ